jgi:hypothetical protein
MRSWRFALRTGVHGHDFKSASRFRRVKFVPALTLGLLLVAAPAANQAQRPPIEQDAGKQRAIEQLRAIAEGIKKCPDAQFPDDYGKEVVSAPLNVVWDVVQRETAHSNEIGYIEYVTNENYISNPLKDCKKRDSKCQWDNWEAAQMTSILLGVHPPDQFRFEFDLGTNGLEFRRSEMKHQTDDETHWVADRLGGCEGNAVLMTLNSRPPQIRNKASLNNESAPSAERIATLKEQAAGGNAEAQFGR